MNQTLAHLLTVRDSVQIRACQYTFLGWNWGWQLASDLPSSRECIPILGNWKWSGILWSDQYGLPMYFSWVKSPFESQTAMCLQPAVSQGKGIWTSLQSLRPKSSWKLSNCHQHEKGKGGQCFWKFDVSPFHHEGQGGLMDFSQQLKKLVEVK